MLIYVPIVYGFLPEINVFVFVFDIMNKSKIIKIDQYTVKSQ